MKITIETTQTETRSGSKNNREWSITTQPAFMRGERVAGEISLVLRANSQPYPLGDYEIDFDHSLSIGSFGRVEFTPVLKAIEQSKSLPFGKTA